MNLKKTVGGFFKPKNMFSRGARLGGAALGAGIGGPQGAMTGYNLGDKLAGTWEDDAQADGGMQDLVMRGKMPGGGGAGAGFGGGPNLFSRTASPSGPNIDLKTILRLAQVGGRL